MITTIDKIKRALKVGPDSHVRIEIESGGMDEGGTLTKLLAEFPRERIGELKADNWTWLDRLKGWEIPAILFGTHCNVILDDVDYIDGCIKLHYFQKPPRKRKIKAA